MLTKDELELGFSYDPVRGGLIRSKGVRGIRAGTYAGQDFGTYRVVTINGVRHKEHVLVWLWHTGQYSHKDFEHLNGNKRDNRIENLREVTTTTYN